MIEKLKLFVIGMLMGAAEIVPGVSGGTIAFITGIYGRLIHAINQVNFSLLTELKKMGIRSVWSRVDGTFLVSLLSGMLCSVFLFASSIQYLLREEPILIWSFFFGLVIASVWHVSSQIDKPDWRAGLLIGVGAASGLVITHLIPIEIPPTSVNLFLAGAVAICAWILPGLSGSFILLVLGLYHYLIDAIAEMDVLFLLTLGSGCLVGILSFARLLDYFFTRYRDQTLSLLTGFMMGSLVKLWPWQNVTSYQIKSNGTHVPLVQNPISPMTYEEITGNSPELLFALLGLLLGFISVLGLAALARYGEAYRDKV
jgi:putative membrane protein